MTSVLFLDDSILCHSIISIKQKATLGYYKHFTHHHSNKNLVPTFSNLGGVGVGGDYVMNKRSTRSAQRERSDSRLCSAR